MREKDKLIIWDFDGVLFDSLRECAVVLLLSIKILNNTFDFEPIENIDQLSSDKEINSILKKIRPLRPFIIKGQDYIWQYINYEKFDKVFSRFSDYKEIFDSIYDNEKDKIYEKTFYEARKLLQISLKESYFNLFFPFKGALAAIKESISMNKNYICSARDFNAIKFMLERNGIYFNENKIYAKDHNNGKNDQSITKREQIKNILSIEGYLDKEFILIEDQINLPLTLMKEFSKIKIIYAKYGYGKGEECSIFNEESISFIEESESILKLVVN